MKECLKLCKAKDIACPNNDCRMWVDYEEDLNCVHEVVKKNGGMTLREIAKRMGISFVRVKQIQDKALKKISKLGRDCFEK